MFQIAVFCCVCGKKPSRNRTLDPCTAVCSVCSSGENPQGITTPNGDAAAAIEPEVNDHVVLSELTFGDLKKLVQRRNSTFFLKNKRNIYS